MSGAEWAWIIGAGAWALLMVVLSLVLLNVMRVVSRVADLVEGVSGETIPLIRTVTETVSGVNVELARVDAIVGGVQHMTATADSLLDAVHDAVTAPLIKFSAFVYGVKRGARKLRG